MTVAKRVRYEVLKRDNYTCRYCSAHAPEAVLQVDHVIPVVLGGEDKPSNLVTACRDCNAGKSSTKPEDEIVESVSEKALAVAKIFREYLEDHNKKSVEHRAWLENIRNYWDETMPDYVRISSDWKQTFSQWRSIGIGTATILEAIDIAANKNNLPDSKRFKYMCGIVWNVVRKAKNVALSDDDVNSRCGHCPSCIGDDPEADCYVYEPDENAPVCDKCSDPHCLYYGGYLDGLQAGSQYEWQRNYEAIMHYRTCPEVRADGQ